MQCNEYDFKVRDAKRLMGLEIHQGGVNLANSLEWQSATTFMR